MIARPKMAYLKLTQKADPSVEIFPNRGGSICGVGIPHGSGPESRKIYGVA
jgi:hypothetical protein